MINVRKAKFIALCKKFDKITAHFSVIFYRDVVINLHKMTLTEWYFSFMRGDRSV